MSNLLLRSLREAGVIRDWVLPFARANAAVSMTEICNQKTPNLPRTVVVLDGVNTGDYWVVSEADAERLEAKGYTRYVTKPAQAPVGPETPLQ